MMYGHVGKLQHPFLSKDIFRNEKHEDADKMFLGKPLKSKFVNHYLSVLGTSFQLAEVKNQNLTCSSNRHCNFLFPYYPGSKLI